MARDKSESARKAGSRAHRQGVPRVTPEGRWMAPGLAAQWLAGWDASEALTGGPNNRRRKGHTRRFDRGGPRD